MKRKKYKIGPRLQVLWDQTVLESMTLLKFLVLCQKTLEKVSIENHQSKGECEEPDSTKHLIDGISFILHVRDFVYCKTGVEILLPTVIDGSSPDNAIFYWLLKSKGPVFTGKLVANGRISYQWYIHAGVNISQVIKGREKSYLEFDDYELVAAMRTSPKLVKPSKC